MNLSLHAYQPGTPAQTRTQLEQIAESLEVEPLYPRSRWPQAAGFLPGAFPVLTIGCGVPIIAAMAVLTTLAISAALNAPIPETKFGVFRM